MILPTMRAPASCCILMLACDMISRPQMSAPTESKMGIPSHLQPTPLYHAQLTLRIDGQSPSPRQYLSGIQVSASMVLRSKEGNGEEQMGHLLFNNKIKWTANLPPKAASEWNIIKHWYGTHHQHNKHPHHLLSCLQPTHLYPPLNSPNQH